MSNANRLWMLVVALLISSACFGQTSIIELKNTKMNETISKYGIEGYQAPELQVPIWIDGYGNETEQIILKGLEGKFKVIYCFQAWCPGCHSRGLPALKKMVEDLKDSDKVEF